MAAATPFPLELVYRAALFVAYLALGASVYWLALEFGLRRSIAVWAGLLTLGSYPVFTGLGIFGWFSTMVALPLGLFGDGLLERANRTQKGRLAVWGGVLFAGCLLAHHMTAIGLALGLVPWLLYQYWTGAGDRRRLTRNVVLFSAGGVAVGGLWGVFFLVHILSVGFERELAGNWRFSLEGYRSRLLDRELIGVEIYPSYLGWVQVPLAAGGVLRALLSSGRMRGPAISLIALTWFSLGTAGLPLINYYPFSGLDVARFALFMAPFMALMGGYLLIGGAGGDARALQSKLSLPAWVAPGVVVLGAGLLLVLPALDVKDVRPTLSPISAGEELDPAMEWLVTETEEDATILAVGFRNWDA